ncbi:MAG: cellulase family glycosylhydrolase [bacterium]
MRLKIYIISVLLIFCTDIYAFDKNITQLDIRVGILSDQFTLNGQPTFLLGVSYFDGRNFHQSDLNKLAANGFNLIRIWLDWRTDNFFDENGSWREGAEQDLIGLVDYANSQGLVVDVTILDNNMSFGDSQSKRRQVVQKVVEALKGKTNILFDLVNEHNHIGYNTIVSHGEASLLRSIVKTIDQDRIVTISSTGCHILCGSTIDGLDRTNIQEELNEVKVDVLTTHFLRDDKWARKTGQRVTILKNYLVSIGKNIPIYLQEEDRRSDGTGPDADDFLTAAVQARDAGAAGWIFHTSAGYNLAENDFFKNLDLVEQMVVNELPIRIFGSKNGDSDNIAPSPPKGVNVTVDSK